MKVPILMYHMVCETNDPKEKRYCCHPKAFKRQMAHLKKGGYCIITLEQLVDSIINGNTLPQKSVVITFDDGFMDNYKTAFPVLRKNEFPATVFIVSRLLGQSNEWMQKEGYPKRQLLGLDKLKEMTPLGISIGAHTATHPHLTELPPEVATREIENSKNELEQQLGLKVNFFAYPYGEFNNVVKTAVVRAGFKAACSAVSGFNGQNADPFALKRTAVHGTDHLWQFALKLYFGTNKATLMLPLRYYWSRICARLT